MRLNLGTAVRAVVTYTVAAFLAAVSATAVTVPLGPQPPAIFTAVWISAAVTAGWPAVLLCDHITFGPEGGRR